MRKKGKLASTLSLILFLVIIVLQIGFVLFDVFHENADDGNVVIEQDIGGELNCEAECFDVNHSYYWDVNYDYLPPNGDTIHFQKGSFYGRNWDERVQLKKVMY